MRPYLCILFLTALFCLPAAAQTTTNDDQVTLTELFYGMNWDEKTGRYTYSEPRLEKFASIKRMECKATWYVGGQYSEVHEKYKPSLGLYIDKEWPSEAVQRVMEEIIDLAFINQICALHSNVSEYDPSRPLINRIRTSHIPTSTNEILAFAKDVFSAYSEVHKREINVSYTEAHEGRICIVAHKIYEDSTYATYIVEESYSYWGSNGCPSLANYYTINKSSGHILSASEVLASMPKEEAFRQIRRLITANPSNYPMQFPESTMDDFIDSLSGAAFVKEGYLLYYLPYTVGCGADGEPLFVLRFKR